MIIIVVTIIMITKTTLMIKVTKIVRKTNE